MHEPLSIVMCDIDKFKSVNDTHGHQVGDLVLREFAGILREAVREIDRVGRYGGEEFLLLLPGTPGESAMTFAERLRLAVKDHKFRFDGGSLSRTMSCGIADWPHPGIRDEESLLKAADEALYVAKESGRDKVVLFDSPEHHAHTNEEPVINGDESPREAPRRAAGGNKSSESIGAS
jgi:diguanylate cyclase (GGDEF)-like protein